MRPQTLIRLPRPSPALMCVRGGPMAHLARQKGERIARTRFVWVISIRVCGWQASLCLCCQLQLLLLGRLVLCVFVVCVVCAVYGV